MNPSNHWQARTQIHIMMIQKITGRSPRTKKEILRTYENIAEQIWRRWQVGPYRWKLKNLRWYLEVKTKNFAPGTRYRHWLRIAEVILVLNKYEQWEKRLCGPWRNPKGLPPQSSTRGRKSKFLRSKTIGIEAYAKESKRLTSNASPPILSGIMAPDPD